MPVTLHTERLLLRPFTLDDAEAFFPLMALPEVVRYVGNQQVQSVQQVQQYLHDHPLRDYRIYGYGRLALIHRDSGRLIGFSGIKFITEIQQSELGYRLLPEFWGQGLATEAGLAVLGWAQQLGLHELVALIHPQNHGSKAVVAKLGFQFQQSIQYSLLEQDTELWCKQI
ncbi:GNAT family N-acetyltransferase [Rheinheimera marina]|uniref:GNAT family N-acetyltransferase n=1 Tax=Rheinheimera marina TaxID=1774958 RepID=A0ABV9JKC5_9GAMM